MPDVAETEDLDSRKGNLRRRLRQDTRPMHDWVEGVYDRHDIRTREGLAVLLQAHALALSVCLQALPASRQRARQGFQDLLGAIEADLATLGIDRIPAQSSRAPSADIHPLGLIYVVAGSRLGANVLLARVQGSTAPDVRQATQYLACEAGKVLWRDVRTALEDWRGSADEETDIIMAAQKAFTWFGDACAEIERKYELHDRQYGLARHED
ncbi:biliverdin-producing heme oxygenase [Henriciella aquimarina]|uniref:biliverdin-producing heme oxygenase n=1 Tax=Henriciella aquimarina TaxID=545261 RepID=UPI00117A1358|nr:biliverdin-producing heme oxygenase [Henriciella aquimarina]